MKFQPIILAVTLVMLSSTKSQSESNFVIKAGWNYSAFRDQDHEIKTGFILGIEKEWFVSRNWGIISGLSYSTRGGKLYDKVFGNGENGLSMRRHSNLVASIGFLDWAILPNFRLPLGNTISLFLYSGISLSIGLRDYSEYQRGDWILDETERANTPIDYYWGYKEGLGPLTSSAVCSQTGVGIRWKYFSFELRYLIPNHGLYDADVILLEGKKYHTLNFIFGIWPTWRN